MKILSEIRLSITDEELPGFIEKIYERGFSVNSLSLIEENDGISVFEITVAYNNGRDFEKFILETKNTNTYSILSVVNSMEKEIVGGLLNISGKLPFENQNEFQTNVLGATELIQKKIDEGNGIKYTSISRNVGMVCAADENRTTNGLHNMLHYYALAEADSVILHQFTGLNGFPLVVSFNDPENIIRSIRAIEQSFSALRLINLDFDDLGLYERIITGVNIPVISREYDDIPLYLLSLLIKVIVQNRLKAKETTLGFIGINNSAVRLTRLLYLLGCYRVLGYDNNENRMLSIENQNGLATTAENILNNADITILFQDILIDDEYRNIRPGQYIISLVPLSRAVIEIINGKGARGIIEVSESELSKIFPGILQGTIKSGLTSLDDHRLINLAKKITKLTNSEYKFPGIFTDIHEKTASLLE